MTLDVRARLAVGDLDIDVAFCVDRGETVALVGPNGAGKTSVLRAISGLDAIDAGRIRFDDQTWDDPAASVHVEPAARRVGVVFQDYLLFEHLCSVDNVAFGLRARGADAAAARTAALEELHRLGIADLAERRPSSLSGGESQRVALARALVTDPDVVLLDEPLAALDATTRASVRRDLRDRLATTDACRIVVTHDPIDAYALADRVVVIERGHVTQSGAIAELAGAPRSTYVADLLGTNMVRGTLSGSRLAVEAGGELAVGAHDTADGPVLATVHPSAIALHRQRPEGSPRNVWQSTIESIDYAPDRVRVQLGAPFALAVEITPSGLAALEITQGETVWASVKASEIAVAPA